MPTRHPSPSGSTRWTISAGPTRHVHESSAFAVIFAGTGTTPSRRAAPIAPFRTSGVPSPHAPRTCGAHDDHASGRDSSAQAASGEASESAVQVRTRSGLPAQHPLERVVLAGRGEDVVGLLDLAEAEVVGAELLGLDATVAGELEQRRDGAATDQARGD